jgi:hypothetical protein
VPNFGSLSSPSQQSWFSGMRTVLMCQVVIRAAPAASGPTALLLAVFE